MTWILPDHVREKTVIRYPLDRTEALNAMEETRSRKATAEPWASCVKEIQNDKGAPTRTTGKPIVLVDTILTWIRTSYAVDAQRGIALNHCGRLSLTGPRFCSSHADDRRTGNISTSLGVRGTTGASGQELQQRAWTQKMLGSTRDGKCRQEDGEAGAATSESGTRGRR